MARRADSVLDLIGNTPIIRLGRVIPETSATVWAKVEAANPGGSVKDRIALAMVEAAERDGLLRPGATIVEPTSGNTGIGLALVSAVKGYRLLLTMPDDMSVERRALLSQFGAEIVLTPAIEGMSGAVHAAAELAREHGYFMPQQFTNLANPDVHRRTTALEILEALGERLDAAVIGVGTGGTLTGIGSVLKEKLVAVQIVAVEPSRSAVLSGGRPGLHRIQGMGAGFIPGILDRSLIDEVIAVSDEDSIRMSRRLAREEGLLVGVSSGANVHAASLIAERLGAGKTIVTILPDTGERYLSMAQSPR